MTLYSSPPATRITPAELRRSNSRPLQLCIATRWVSVRGCLSVGSQALPRRLQFAVKPSYQGTDMLHVTHNSKVCLSH